MNVPSITWDTAFSPAAIDECSEKVRGFLENAGVSKQDRIRYTLSVEEILLESQKTAEDSALFHLRAGKSFFRPFFQLEIEGAANNVYSRDKTKQSALGDSLLRNLGLAPEYSFSEKGNRYFFRLRRKSLNPFMTLSLTLILSLAVGFLGLLLPEGFRTDLVSGFLEPLHDTFLNILGCIAGPMVFLSVAWGIYGIGDAATLKQIGKKTLFSYIGADYLAIIGIGFLCLPLFRLTFSQSEEAHSGLMPIFAMILGIFSKNIFSPFVDGNTLQIIFLAVVIGIALLFLGQKTGAVAKAVEQINYIIQFLIEFISKLVPYFIFIVLVQMIWSDLASVFLSVFKVFIIFIGAGLLAATVLVGYTAIKNRVSPLLLVKKGLPTFIVALTTASSAAAFGVNMSACRKEYGIDEKMASFGIPLGMVTFKVSTSINYLTLSLFFAEIYQIEVSPSWIFTLFFITGILAIATPPIPGGAMTAYTVLFSGLEIPTEALAVALACDTIFDFLSTGLDQFLLPLPLLNQSMRLGLVDRKKLEKK